MSSVTMEISTYPESCSAGHLVIARPYCGNLSTPTTVMSSLGPTDKGSGRAGAIRRASKASIAGQRVQMLGCVVHDVPIIQRRPHQGNG